MLANLLGGEDFLIVVIIALVIFGAGQLPKIARNLGEAQKELKRAMRDDEDDAPTTTGATTTADAPAPTTDAPRTAADTKAGAEVKDETSTGTRDR